MNSIRRRSAVLAGMLLLSTLTVRPALAAPPDTWITTKAKIALLTTEGAGRTDVKVDTSQGMVTLHGKVESQAVKDKAAATVQKIDGVANVRNLVQVVPVSAEKAVKASDAELKDAVTKALKANKDLQGIKVESVDNGVVILSGKTKTLEQKLLALQTAYYPGVRSVASQIESEEK